MQPGFWDITGRKHNFCPSGYSHGQVLQQSVKYFMLLRGVPLSENICNENIQIMMSCHHIEYMRLSY